MQLKCGSRFFPGENKATVRQPVSFRVRLRQKLSIFHSCSILVQAVPCRERRLHHCSQGLLLLGFSFFPNSLASRPSCLEAWQGSSIQGSKHMEKARSLVPAALSETAGMQPPAVCTAKLPGPLLRALVLDLH